MDSDKAFSTVLYLRPNFDSDNLASEISQKYNKIKKMIRSTSKKTLERAYPSIGEGIIEAVSAIYPESVQITIDSEDSFNNLIEEIKNAPKPFVGKVY